MLAGVLERIVELSSAAGREWKAGDRRRVDGYLERRGPWRRELFARLAQAAPELADVGSGERSIRSPSGTTCGQRTPAPSRAPGAVCNLLI